MRDRREYFREYMRRRRAADPGRAREENRKAYDRAKGREAVDPALREKRVGVMRRWQEENRERLAEKARLRYDRLRENPVSREELLARNREGSLRYRGAEKNRAKVEARWRAAAAVKAGVLKRGPCGVCGDERSQMHHPDYGKPLEVEWLCRKHHLERHRSTDGPPPTALHPDQGEEIAPNTDSGPPDGASVGWDATERP